MIALHNIPEGIAPVTPHMAAGMGKLRAVIVTTLSGLMEPIGALIGLIVLLVAGGGGLISGFGLAFTAGVMTNVTIDELIPVAHEFCKPVNTTTCQGAYSSESSSLRSSDSSSEPEQAVGSRTRGRSHNYLKSLKDC